MIIWGSRSITSTVGTGRFHCPGCVGVYRVLRHPSDTGIVLVAVGGAILLASPTALAVALGSGICFGMARVRRERDVLERGFGTAYRRYAAATPGGLPDGKASPR